jgi:hypothetical protein
VKRRGRVKEGEFKIELSVIKAIAVHFFKEEEKKRSQEANIVRVYIAQTFTDPSSFIYFKTFVTCFVTFVTCFVTFVMFYPKTVTFNNELLF